MSFRQRAAAAHHLKVVGVSDGDTITVLDASSRQDTGGRGIVRSEHMTDEADNKAGKAAKKRGARAK